MADVLSITLIILGLLVTLPALWLFLGTLFPGAVERGRTRLESSPGVCFLAGLLPWVLLFVGGIALLSKGSPPIKFLGFLLVAGGFIVEGIGLAAVSAIVGSRLPGGAGAPSPWREFLRGAVCMELAFLLPIVGWFFLMPLVSIAAVGATLLAAASRSGGAAVPSAPVPAMPAVPAA